MTQVVTEPMAPGTRRLEGRSALVTGAANGIGLATAELFAHEGARLVINDVDEPGLDQLRARLDGQGREAVAVVGDVSTSGDVGRMVDAAVEAYGQLDVAVANAGIILLSDIAEATVEEWDHVMAVDGRGMFLTCKYATEQMRRSGGGSIVCLSSISGLAGQSSQSTYGPAKFVASGLTKHLAVECAADGIRVNAVAPGTIRTRRVAQLVDEPGGRGYLEAIERMHPLGRLGEPAEVAHAILFLASPESSFITGTILPVDGGYLAQ